jgi:hypothetical protein
LIRDCDRSIAPTDGRLVSKADLADPIILSMATSTRPTSRTDWIAWHASGAADQRDLEVPENRQGGLYFLASALGGIQT